ncbi:unnamed protein product [Bemisia tabaci]|uniref:Alpha N-terminal protein methyltransferase 1 n=1 Tax=Bemisia tabaci TaxID=7038 RepID=A0A9P0F402_BEMTA|nr:PREDICTED: alpha N-terminal protein methyltransferase 1 [Bemisia tabaci]CAH0388767.1 unnamed protein product [Bemisia tabaci]
MSSDTEDQITSPDEFYEKCYNHWSKIPATMNGVLDGLSHISCIDVSGSEEFLEKIYRTPQHPGKSRALDCGAGIGRVTKYLLAKFFDKVDLVEQNPTFIEEAKKSLSSNPKVDQFICVGLQNFMPDLEGPKYDVVWIQWVMQNVVDEDVVKFLKKCKLILNERGIIVLKENVTSSDEDDIDTSDSTITRSCKSYNRLFKEAKLHCFRTKVQRKFPKELYSVMMFATKPYSKESVK